MPCVPPGPQRMTRNSPIQPPDHRPCRAIASCAYSEQVGICRQLLPTNPDSVSWYSRTIDVPSTLPGVLRQGPGQLRPALRFCALCECSLTLLPGGAFLNFADGLFT